MFKISDAGALANCQRGWDYLVFMQWRGGWHLDFFTEMRTVLFSFSYTTTSLAQKQPFKRGKASERGNRFGAERYISLWHARYSLAVVPNLYVLFFCTFLN